MIFGNNADLYQCVTVEMRHFITSPRVFIKFPTRSFHFLQKTSPVYLDHPVLAKRFMMRPRPVTLVLLEPKQGPAFPVLNLSGKSSIRHR